MEGRVDRYTQKWGMRQVRLFGRFFIWSLYDDEPGLKIVRLGDGEDDIACHFNAAWNYFTKVTGSDQSGYFRWAFRGCTAYGARAVRIVRRAYKNRRYEVDMELTPGDFKNSRTGDNVQWHRVIAIDGPFTRVSSVKEFWSDEEIAEYRKKRAEGGKKTYDTDATPPDPEGSVGDAGASGGADGD